MRFVSVEIIATASANLTSALNPSFSFRNAVFQRFWVALAFQSDSRP